MNNLDKEKWVEETLGSLEGITRAEPSAGLFEKAMLRVSRAKARVVSMSRTQVWSAAACGMVLIAANVVMCLQFGKPAGQHNQQEAFAREYFVFSEPPQY